MSDSRVHGKAAQVELDFLGRPDYQGHMYFCPVMGKLHIQHYGRENLDPVTLANLADFASRPTNCTQCRLDAMPEPDRSHARAVLATALVRLKKAS